MDAFSKIVIVLNDFLGKVLPWVGTATVLYFNGYMLLKWFQSNIAQHKKQGGKDNSLFWGRSFGRAIYFLLILVLFQAIVLIIFYYSNYWWLRWLEVIVFFSLTIYVLTVKKSGTRGLFTAFWHTFTIFIGWLFGEWLGILFISTPLLAVFYYWLFRLARVVVPASNPDDVRETLKRFSMLFWYMWGFQFPVWVVEDPQGRVAQEHIPGSIFKNFGGPGMLWVKPYQVAGITKGPQFSRVDGLGVIYTGPYERPYEVLDLRIQIRASKIQAITGDGILYNAILLVVFSLDREKWSDEKYKVLRSKNPVLRGSQNPDRSSGSYWYSRGRVTAALSIEGVKRFQETLEHPLIYWDQWVLMLAEEAARKELSKRQLNELWRPENDNKEANALDTIASNIKESIAGELKENGIQLIVARVVNFEFESEKAQEIQKRQIRTWESMMDQEIKKMEAEAAAKTVQIREEAMAYARFKLLSAIAKGLEQVSERYYELPMKHVIAMHFLSTLREGLDQRPVDEETKEKISSVYKRFSRFVPPDEVFG